MPRGYRSILVALAGLAFLFIGGLVGWSLQPKEPSLAVNAGYQAISPNYHPGGRKCEPERLKKLTPDWKRAKETVACEEAAEQHRLASNDLIQQRRAADAANAMTILTYKQTGIAAWGLSLGFITMGAAIAAAFYAREAAKHTETSANSFADAERAIIHIVGGTVTKPFEDGESGVTIECFNRGRSPGRVTEFGVVRDNKSSPRWTTIAPEQKAMVSAFEAPQRGQRLELECWIRYKSLGPKTHTSYFTVTVGRVGGPTTGIKEHWGVNVSNPNGHPNDT